jgi:hypothetical protein
VFRTIAIAITICSASPCVAADVDIDTARSIAGWIDNYSAAASKFDACDPKNGQVLSALDGIGQPMIRFLESAGYQSTERGWIEVSTGKPINE